FNGGMGAMQDRDGPPASGFPANISNTPIEVAETLTPILFGEKRLADGSGGPSRSCIAPIPPLKKRIDEKPLPDACSRPRSKTDQSGVPLSA
ncbi:MAG: hypothetical protein EBX67_02985, partial [Betaproteobacteria bacterium]|nr:hypothetical protein [Betaproteobacteria bacterium]